MYNLRMGVAFLSMILITEIIIVIDLVVYNLKAIKQINEKKVTATKITNIEKYINKVESLKQIEKKMLTTKKTDKE